MSNETYIYYNNKYWVGLFTEEHDGKIIRVGQYIFGLEPTVALLDEWMAKGYPGLILNSVESDEDSSFVGLSPKINPKRRLREVKRSMHREKYSGETRSQKAMADSLESLKKISKKKKQEDLKLIKLEKFEHRKAKKKEKKRGH